MTIRRIVVTGGPGAGKTSLWREIARVWGDAVLPVPEVATLLLAHVFPSVRDEAERCAVQRSIFEVQHALERVHENRLKPGQILLCDRGSPDGAGYWPHGHDDFFSTMQTVWHDELARYEAVLFMESAAVGGLSIAQGNAVRSEDLATASSIDTRLRQVWIAHPNFAHVRHQIDFARKLELGLAQLEAWIGAPAKRG
jgi:predicted ATPase